ncbi:MAG: hypothetical protein CL596_04020 [Alteromonas sp.]|nr:hypothetical protein [Alteromonas sp.]MAY21896.1 hypothetical protein [Flavobacteriaceae bacterium]|tara:strand:+ start:673 stop:1374 length:702 start_codon:yes stop_codon:yes gene_type:complete
MLKRCFILLLLSFIGASAFGQDSLAVKVSDPNYREDQFYVGVTYNLITRVPSNINLKGLSGGVNFGFIRDMPLNKQRNVAIGLGLGLSFDRYGETLFIGESQNEQTLFSSLDETIEYDVNRFSTATVEIPIEFRWRTSTESEYKFWRIYTGARLGYVYWYQSFFSQPNNEVSQTDIPEFQQLQLAATLSVGYSTFNFYANYSVTPFFTNAVIGDTQEEIAFAPLKIGIIFYIL